MFRLAVVDVSQASQDDDNSAVVLANLMDYDLDEYTGSSDFTDVPAWALPYVDACYANGLVAGKGDGLYGGEDTVTNAEASLMIMKVLGYFQYASDFGSDWKLATIKQADKIDLFEDVAGGANTAMTRNSVAQLALNALESSVVEVFTAGTESTTIKTNDIDIVIPGEPAVYTAETVAAGGVDYDETTSTNGTLELIEKLFDDDFTKVPGAEDLYGRAGYEWKDEDLERVVLVAEDADYVLVAKESYASVADLVEDLGMEKKFTTSTLPGYAVDAGEIVELWVSSDDSKVVVDDIVYKYLVAEITEVEDLDEDLDEDEIEAGASVAITFDDSWTVTDIELDGYNAKTYVEGAYVLFPATWAAGAGYSMVVEAAHEFVEDSYTADIYVDTVIAETFEGKVQGQGSDYIKVDGVKYNNDVMNAVTTGTEYTFVKDVNDVILLAVEVEDEEEIIPVDDVVFLYDMYTPAAEEDKYGNTVTTTYAQLVNMKGEISEVIVKIVKDYADPAKTDETFGIDTYTEDVVYTAKEYSSKKVIDSVDYKGTTKLTAWDYDTDKIAVIDGEGLVFATDASKNAAVRYNDKVTFVLVEGADDDVETEVKTGKQNVTLPAGSIIIADKDNGNNVAAYVYAPGATVSSSVSYDDVIWVDVEASIYNTTIEIDDEDVDVDVFDPYDAKGDKVEITVDDGALVGEVSGFYTYSIEDGVYTLDYLGDEAGEVYNDVDQEGAAYAHSFVSYYGTLLTTDGADDLETEGATWIDLHETDEDEAAFQWAKAVKSLAALKKAVNDGGCDFDIAIYAEDEAAKIIVITDAE